MTWVVPLALVGFAVLLMATFTMLSARRRHHQATTPVVVGGPRILVHDINDDRCTGCDACVAVCPTNVLDLVANKSRVLRFEDCIQCEACMFACPTEALVMFPQGNTPPPLKVPEVDDNFQTVVPGQYLIGEVAGKPLVKNAANLGRAVVEHMLRTGIQPGLLGRTDTIVDVAIVGSGPSGLSAALSCIQRGLSFVVLEKEQMIASTILRYPKGKLVMAEPYDTVNYSLLPVFDAAKEQLIPIWQELLQRLGLRVNQGESVETVTRGSDGAFEVRTTVASYRAQRVVLCIGTRGKPRTLQVPGENLPKIYSLLEDPDEWRGKSALVVGGGDSACEAALALADAGAKVMISYRGKSFNRAAPKNKAALDAYAAEGRLKTKLGSQILQFDGDSVTLALGDGSQKRYANDAAFVLIGADPPIAWLEKVGVKFVERPHQYQMGKTDDVVRRFIASPMECPEDAARAAAQILGGSLGIEPAVAAQPGMDAAAAMAAADPVKGPRKWLRSATSIFSNRNGTQSGVHPMAGLAAKTGGPLGQGAARSAARPNKKLDQPMPLSEFAKRSKEVPRSTDGGFGGSTGSTNMTGVSTGGTGVGHVHTGHGRRDQLSAGERTRILRMLRDEGGRIADEDSAVYIGAPPPVSPGYDFDFDAPDSQRVPPPAARPDVPAKPAVVIGIAAAQQSRRSKKPGVGTGAPMPAPADAAPLHLPNSPDPIPTRDAREARLSSGRARSPSIAPPSAPGRSRPVPPKRTVPPPFSEEATRQVDENLLGALRTAPAASPPKGPSVADRLPGAPPPRGAPFDQEATRMAKIDPPRAYDRGGAGSAGFAADEGDEGDEAEATRVASIDALTAMERMRKQGNDDSTRAVNIRNDPSISDIDWDLD